MYCRTCGSKVDENAEVCINCGCKPLTGKAYCQNCGAKTIEQQELCTQCGVRLQSAISGKNNKPMDMKILIPALLLGVPLGLVWLALSIAFPPLFIISGIVASILDKKRKEKAKRSEGENANSQSGE